MPLNRQILMIFLAFAIIITPACVKSASEEPKGGEGTSVPSEEPMFPVPGTADDVMGQLSSFATQTAIALSGPSTTQEVMVTPEVSGSEEPNAAQVTASQAPEATQPASQPSEKFVPKKRTVPSSYTLKKGEHPYCIARRFNVNPATMLKLSGLSAGGSYSSGTVLKIPQSGQFPGGRELKNHPTTYTVGSGDTFFSIACLFGDVWPEDIADANNLKIGSKLSSGQKLSIP